jgi:hypothetical protein
LHNELNPIGKDFFLKTIHLESDFGEPVGPQALPLLSIAGSKPTAFEAVGF